ncbi:ninjurin-2 isoform X1 [Nannospalax galili]|uniref:ninjurin-2 isoform X1 n=1 Tax=Nannospalax galili TaxID=1026970 RepID=UPI0004ED5C7E|nr:ninjurin-2 isoform X1 [Nannospalax galili]
MESDGEMIHLQRDHSSPRGNQPINLNHYATKKSVAESMLDVALFMSNATRLKAVLEQGPFSQYYTVLITLISISLLLQVIIGILLVVIGPGGWGSLCRKARPLGRMGPVPTNFHLPIPYCSKMPPVLGFRSEVPSTQRRYVNAPPGEMCMFGRHEPGLEVLHVGPAPQKGTVPKGCTFIYKWV